MFAEFYRIGGMFKIRKNNKEAALNKIVESRLALTAHKRFAIRAFDFRRICFVGTDRDFV